MTLRSDHFARVRWWRSRAGYLSIIRFFSLQLIDNLAIGGLMDEKLTDSCRLIFAR